MKPHYFARILRAPTLLTLPPPFAYFHKAIKGAPKAREEGPLAWCGEAAVLREKRLDAAGGGCPRGKIERSDDSGVRWVHVRVCGMTTMCDSPRGHHRSLLPSKTYVHADGPISGAGRASRATTRGRSRAVRRQAAAAVRGAAAAAAAAPPARAAAAVVAAAKG